jgi:hypothetical protein
MCKIPHLMRFEKTNVQDMVDGWGVLEGAPIARFRVRNALDRGIPGAGKSRGKAEAQQSAETKKVDVPAIFRLT